MLSEKCVHFFEVVFFWKICLHIEVASWDFSVDGNTTSNHKQPFPLFLFGGFGFEYKPPLGHTWRSSLSQEIDAHDMRNLYAFQVTTFNTYGPEWNGHCYLVNLLYQLRGYIGSFLITRSSPWSIQFHLFGTRLVWSCSRVCYPPQLTNQWRLLQLPSDLKNPRESLTSLCDLGWNGCSDRGLVRYLKLKGTIVALQHLPEPIRKSSKTWFSQRKPWSWSYFFFNTSCFFVQIFIKVTKTPCFSQLGGGFFRFHFLPPFPEARSLSAATEAKAAKEAKEAMEARYQCPP